MITQTTNNKVSVSFSSGFLRMLCLIFIVLKLTGLIKWSWFWVLSPVILPIILVLITAGIFALVKK